MKTILLIAGLVLFMFTSAIAQEKSVGDVTATLGIMPWESIQTASKDKPAVHTDEFHLKMARAMSAMHGGGAKNTYHVMVMLKDKSTGESVKHADVTVTADAKAGPETVTRKLAPMSMDGSSGYGQFFKLTFKGPYVFKVDIQAGYRHHTLEFERTVQ